MKAEKDAKGKWELALSDSNKKHGINQLTTDAKPGAKIYWEADDTIEKIKLIVEKPNGSPIFKTKPHRKSDHTWKAKISKKAGVGENCSYSITYEVKAPGDPIVTDDPKIQVSKP